MVTPSFGIVPELRRSTSGSGVEFETVLWRFYPVPEFRPGFQMGSAEAEGELTTALAEATNRLTRLDVAHWRPELARRPTGAAPPGEHRDAAAGLRPALAAAVRAGQHPRPGSGAGRAQRTRRRRQRLRGGAARRGAAPADQGVPAGPGRRLQRSVACLTDTCTARSAVRASCRGSRGRGGAAPAARRAI
nr:hypothetical protein GCM10020092_083440 [Actinoplanes digitatis]